MNQALEDRGRRERLLKFMKFLGKPRSQAVSPLFSNGNSPTLHGESIGPGHVLDVFFWECI